jgi:hypothetical protein
MNSPAMILTAAARFLLQGEHVEAGDSDGGHYKARGGLCRRRRPDSVRLGFRFEQKFGTEEEETRAGFVVGVFILLG